MKKIIIVVFAVLMACVSNAQENAVKVSFSEGFRPYDLLTYEFSVKEKSSISLGLGYGYLNERSIKKSRTTFYTSYGIGAQYRYYFSKSLTGWYVSGDAGYMQGEVSVILNSWNLFGSTGLRPPVKSDFNAITIATKGGRQWVFNKAPINGLLFDLNFGLANTHMNFESTRSEIKNLKTNRFDLVFVVGVGYAF